MKLFPAPSIPTDKIPECRPHIKRGEHLRLYRFSPDDFLELSAVFNGRHPETGENLVIADQTHPEGAPATDLPPQRAVFAPGADPEMIAEIATRLRRAAGLPSATSGVVAKRGQRRMIRERLPRDPRGAVVPEPTARALAGRGDALKGGAMTSEGIDDAASRPDGELTLLQRLSREMGQMQKQAFGKGPLSTKSYLFDDLLLVVMREGLTVAERTMLDFGRDDLVRAFRQQFQNDMTSRIIEMIEELTERKVLTYQSQVMFNPDVIAAVFVFDRATEGGFVAAEARG